MKYKYRVLICCLFIALSASVFLIIHFYDTPDYLGLSFESPCRKSKIVRMEVTDGIDLNGYKENDYDKYFVITNIEMINKVIEYLNNIPLEYMGSDDNYYTDGDGGLILFYDDAGINVAVVAFSGENTIQCSHNMEIFKPCDNNINIITELENLM